MIEAPEFQKSMSTAEFHYRAGRYVREREKKLGLKNKSLLAAALRARGAALHVLARRFIDRHERGGKGTPGQQTRL
jgi:hypothetical protein